MNSSNIVIFVRFKRYDYQDMKQNIKEPSVEHSYTYKYPHPAVTADCVVFALDGTKFKVLLVERSSQPYKGSWALPGVFLNINETAKQYAQRELKEETGLIFVHLEKFNTFTDVNRNPRERVLSIVFWAFVQIAEVSGNDDAVQARWFAPDELPPLAFVQNSQDSERTGICNRTGGKSYN